MALLGEIIKGVNYFSMCLGFCDFTCNLLYFCICTAFNFESYLCVCFLFSVGLRVHSAQTLNLAALNSSTNLMALQRSEFI